MSDTATQIKAFCDRCPTCGGLGYRVLHTSPPEQERCEVCEFLCSLVARVEADDTAITVARARIATLESYLDKTADGQLVIECEKLYCPKCHNEVRAEWDIAYCDTCVNEEDYTPPWPLFYSMCYAIKPADGEKTV